MWHDLYLSIALLAGACFLLGVAITSYLYQRAKRHEQESYYAECERDFYRDAKEPF